MVVLNILGTIIGLIVLLLLIVLVLPLGVVFRAGSNRKFSVGVRLLGMEFGEEEESKNPLVRFVQKIISGKKREAPPADEETPKSGTDMLKKNVDMLFPLLERVFGVLRRYRISRCRVRCVSGGENAALEYGEVCALLYPFVGHLQNRRRLRKRSTQLDIGWNYESDNSEFDLDITVSVRIAVLVLAALRIFIQYKKRKGEAQ